MSKNIVKVEISENDQELGEVIVKAFNKANKKHLVLFGFLQSVVNGLLKANLEKGEDSCTGEIILDHLDWILSKARYALVNKITLDEAILEGVEPEVEPPYTCPNCEYIEEGLCGDCYVDTLIESQTTN